MKEVGKYDSQWGGKYQLTETNSKVKHQKLREKNIKTAIINILRKFQKTEESMNVVRRDMEDIKMT